MSKYVELFVAYGKSHYGNDPIIIGINSRRLGISLHKTLNSFSHSTITGYDELFFENLVIGYENAFNEDYIKDLEKVVFATTDTIFIMNALLNHKAIFKDFNVTKYPDYVKNTNLNINTNTNVIIESCKYPIKFDINYIENIDRYGSGYSYWNIKFSVIHNQGSTIYHRQERDIIVDNIKWRGGVDVSCPNDVSGWYESFFNERSCTHSSSVAKFIQYLVEKFVIIYNQMI